MSDFPPAVDAKLVRRLHRLVTLLSLVMMVGMIVIVAMLAWQLIPARPLLPQNMALPAGSNAVAVTTGKGFYLILTDKDEILLFTADGRLRQELKLQPDGLLPMQQPPRG